MNTATLLITSFLLSPGTAANDRILQPGEFASPSDEFVLFVDPSHRDGAGPASYRMRRGDEVLWERELPITLWTPSVTNDGRVAGFAYSTGYGNHIDDGILHLVVLAPSGAVLVDEQIERRGTFAMGADPVPVGARTVFVEEHDVVLMQTADAGFGKGLPWKRFRLSTGESLGEWSPPTPVEVARRQAIGITDARCVPTTDLVLLRWWFWDNATKLEGDVFSLVNLAGEEVWKLERRERPRVKPSVRGSIRSVSPTATFTLRTPPGEKQETFRIESRGEGEWDVALVATGAQASPRSDEPATVVPLETIHLEPLGEVAMQVPVERAEGPIRDIASFGFTDAGNVEFIRSPRTSAEGAVGDYVRLNRDGSVDFVTPISPFEPAGLNVVTSWYDGVGDEWFVLMTDWGVESGPRHVRRLNARTGESRAVHGLELPELASIRACRDGGFLVLGTDTLLVVGPDDRLRWQVDGTDPRLGSLFSPTDVTETREGLIVIVDCIADVLHVLSSDGAYLRAVDLVASWGVDPEYPSRVCTDGAGGVWVADHGQLRHMTLEGELLHTWDSDFAFEVDPEGTIWASDGMTLSSYDESGAPAQTFGQGPSRTSLRTPVQASIDARGRVIVRDDRTSTWHVFDSGGRHLFACPAHQAYGFEPEADLEGRLYVPTDHEHYLVHDASGRPLETASLRFGDVLFVPDAHRYWAVRAGSVRLIDDAAIEIAQLDRRPDNRWWSDIRGADIAADGSTFAIVDETHTTTALAVFDPQGRGGRLIDLDGRAGWVRVCAKWAVVGDGETGLVMVRLADGSLHRFQPPAGLAHVEWDFSPSGHELWGFDISRLTLHRWAMPE